MNRILLINPRIYQFGIPLLMLLSISFLMRSPILSPNHSALSLGFTADLIFTVPLVYFLLIRKSKIPNTTVIPVFVLGILLGSLLLPEQNKNYLNLVKTWVLPLVELLAIGILIFKVRKTRKAVLAKNSPDFFTNLKFAAKEMMPAKIAIFFATELAVFYMAIFKWRSPVIRKNEFTYHKNTGTIALLFGLLIAVVIETIVFHLLLKNWSEITAWILTIISVYSGFQIMGFAKSISQRPIKLDGNKLFLPYGILAETSLKLSDIIDIETFAWNAKKERKTIALSPLGDFDSYNIILHLKTEQTIHGFYGKLKKFKSLGIHVDDKDTFIKAIASRQTN